MASAYGFQVWMVICIVWSIILVLTEHTLACRQREPRSDLSGRISLIEGIKKVFFLREGTRLVITQNKFNLKTDLVTSIGELVIV